MEVRTAENVPTGLEGEERRVWEVLADIEDPEIPTISIVELGMIEEVELDGDEVRVGFIPTFSGCPALDVIKNNIADELSERGYSPTVDVLNIEWSTDRIAESAKGKMKDIGLAPPKKHGGEIDAEQEGEVECPYCGETETIRDNPFGPTLCRAIYYCDACQQPFEKFKEL